MPTCSCMVSGSSHPLLRVLFSFPSPYSPRMAKASPTPDDLVRYRTRAVFRIGGYWPPPSQWIFNHWYSGYLASAFPLTPTGLSPSMADLSRPLRIRGRGWTQVQTPHPLWLSPEGSVCPAPLSVAPTQGISLISFPAPTKMFQFGASPFLIGTGQRPRKSHSEIPGSKAACAFRARQHASNAGCTPGLSQLATSMRAIRSSRT